MFKGLSIKVVFFYADKLKILIHELQEKNSVKPLETSRSSKR